MDSDEMYHVSYLDCGRKEMVGNGLRSKISLIPVKIPVSLWKRQIKRCQGRINYRSEFNNLFQLSIEWVTLGSLVRLITFF